jgi:hypothetical protein
MLRIAPKEPEGIQSSYVLMLIRNLGFCPVGDEALALGAETGLPAKVDRFLLRGDPSQSWGPYPYYVGYAAVVVRSIREGCIKRGRLWRALGPPHPFVLSHNVNFTPDLPTLSTQG